MRAGASPKYWRDGARKHAKPGWALTWQRHPFLRASLARVLNPQQAALLSDPLPKPLSSEVWEQRLVAVAAQVGHTRRPQLRSVDVLGRPSSRLARDSQAQDVLP